ncbi:MAG: flagellar protein FlaB [Gammaproteobacteria bacterium]|nr:flagellar protein FlaB [Gammaproteobacteria bacterium]
MALRINTNIAAMSAHKSLIKTDNSLSESLGRLSTGLRINKAADDSSGMAIADSLRSQALGLGQAIRNGNDGISIVQTADAALEESINIVNTIKQKAIQSAQDGQTTESRKAIQADITKLRDNLDNIAKTTAFNNQKLLSGNFTDKKFQIGAYAGETIDISIQSTEATKIGHITTSDLTFADAGVSQLNIYSNLQDKTYSLNSVELAYNNSPENGVGAVADAINKLSDVLGISATASVSSSTDSNITAGTTDTGFKINGVTIGALAVSVNDADGALVAAINNKTSEHGVTASVDQAGVLTMNSTDDRAIEVTMGATTQAVMGGTEDMSTLGKIEVRQEGTSQITITDANSQAGIAVSTDDGLMKVSGTVTCGALDSTLTAGSILNSGSVLDSGTVLQGEITLSGDAALDSGIASTAGAGSSLMSGTVFGCGGTVFTSTLDGGFTVAGLTEDGDLTAGSTLASGSTISSGSVFIGNVVGQLSGACGAVVLSGDGNTYVSGATVKAGGLVMTADAELACGSVISCGSTVGAGSDLAGAFNVSGTQTLTADLDLGISANIVCGSVMSTGSVFGTADMSGGGTITGTMTLEAGSLLGSGSSLANGSTFGQVTAIMDDEIVTAGQDMLLAGGSGSILNSGSILTAGTVLTNDIHDEDGQVYGEGTTLEYDIVTSGTNILLNDQIVNGGSVLSAGTSLAANYIAQADGTESSLTEGLSYRLSDVDVTTQEGAQIGIAVADAALKGLDKVRSDLGSAQNQLVSTISNISTTRVNVSSAESSIRDVDFAEESSNFTKMQILSQAGTFAMSQANASAQQVLSLLQ